MDRLSSPLAWLVSSLVILTINHSVCLSYSKDHIEKITENRFVSFSGSLLVWSHFLTMWMETNIVHGVIGLAWYIYAKFILPLEKIRCCTTGGCHIHQSVTIAITIYIAGICNSGECRWFKHLQAWAGYWTSIGIAHYYLVNTWPQVRGKRCGNACG